MLAVNTEDNTYKLLFLKILTKWLISTISFCIQFTRHLIGPIGDKLMDSLKIIVNETNKDNLKNVEDIKM